MKKDNKKSAAPKSGFAATLRGSIIALLVTLVIVLALAVIVWQTGMETGSVAAAGQGIKLAGALFAALLCTLRLCKRRREAVPPLKAALCGVASAVLYIALCFVVFSMIEGGLGSLPLFLADAASAALLGAAVGFVISRICAPSGAASK